MARFFTRRRSPDAGPDDANRGFLVSLVFLVLLGFLSILIVITDGSARNNQGSRGAEEPLARVPSVPSRPIGTAPGKSTETAVEACPAQSETQEVADVGVLREPPQGVVWSPYRGVRLPSSSEVGPGAVEGDVARCYSRTAEGALVAAVQTVTRYALAEDPTELLRHVAVPDPASTEAASRARPSAGSALPGTTQVIGFRFLSHTNETSVIQIQWRGTTDPFSSIHILQWQGGDWHLRFQPGGLPGTPARPSDGDEGTVTWSPGVTP